jgi:hypothetical protein
MVAPPCYITIMKGKKPQPTTPEQEGIELHPDAWERFERTFEKVVSGHPVHRTGKKAGANRSPKRGARGPAKPSD